MQEGRDGREGLEINKIEDYGRTSKLLEKNACMLKNSA